MLFAVDTGKLKKAIAYTDATDLLHTLQATNNMERLKTFIDCLEIRDSKIDGICENIMELTKIDEQEAGNMKYYEIEFAHRAEIEDESFIGTPDRYSICILAEREPSYEEAENFCKEDMNNLGYDMVSDVLEISKEEAYNFFDMENADNFPIFK
jgi:hypothetical protein